MVLFIQLLQGWYVLFFQWDTLTFTTELNRGLLTARYVLVPLEGAVDPVRPLEAAEELHHPHCGKNLN
jgi:hypothetical protein